MLTYNTVLLTVVALFCIYLLRTSNALQEGVTCNNSTTNNDFNKSANNFTVAYLIFGDTDITKTLSCLVINVTITNNIASLDVFYKLYKKELHLTAKATQQSNGKLTIALDNISITYPIYFEFPSGDIMVGLICAPILGQVTYIAYPTNQPNLINDAESVAASFTNNTAIAKVNQNNACPNTAAQPVPVDTNNVIEVL